MQTVTDTKQALNDVGEKIDGLHMQIRELESRPTQGEQTVRKVTQLAALRAKVSELEKEALKAESEHSKAIQKQGKSQLEAKAKKAPEIYKLVDLKRNNDQAIQKAIDELAELVKQGDEIRTSLVGLVGQDGAVFARRIRTPRAFQAAFKAAGLSERFGIPTVSVRAESYQLSANKLNGSFEGIAKRYEQSEVQ